MFASEEAEALVLSLLREVAQLQARIAVLETHIKAQKHGNASPRSG